MTVPRALRQFLLALGGSSVFFFLLGLSPYGLTWNVTSSIPEGLYLTEELAATAPLARGELACFAYTEPAWAAGRKYAIPGVRICKPVVGLAGDKLLRTGPLLTVVPRNGGRSAQVKLLAADTAGRPLPAQQSGEEEIGPGAVFFLAQLRPNSLDSRYLGAISRRLVTHKIHPVFLMPAGAASTVQPPKPLEAGT